MVQVGSQKLYKNIISQIWLIRLMDDCHLGHITKLEIKHWLVAWIKQWVKVKGKKKECWVGLGFRAWQTMTWSQAFNWMCSLMFPKLCLSIDVNSIIVMCTNTCDMFCKLTLKYSFLEEFWKNKDWRKIN
jgi:hypothetical protein